MSKLDELIRELCPDGVEFKPLVNICMSITTGKLNANSMVENGKYPFFTCDANPFEIDTYAFDTEAILVSGNGSQVGHINYYKGKFNAYQRTYVLSEFIFVEVKYLLHYLRGYLRDYILIHSKKGSVPYITLPMLQNFTVPVPPLEVQHEIVRILDNFKELTEELTEKLTKELAVREKQYKYYSHILFTSYSSKDVVKLGDIVDVCMCKRIKKDNTKSAGDVPFYQNGTLGKEAKLFISKELYEEYKKKYRFPDVGDVMISTVGTIGRTIQYDGKPAYYQDSNIIWFKRKNELILNEYLYWFCLSMPWKISERATLKHLHNYMIVDTDIAIPSIEDQMIIIHAFNRLNNEVEKLQTDLNNEIEARQKQYEYYRDKLLTFKELS